MAAASNSRQIAAAWDPSCSERLQILQDDKDHGAKFLPPLLTGNGGCNKHEFLALDEIVVAHKDYHDCQSQKQGAKILGESCRSAIERCLESWETSDEPTLKSGANDKNLEYLKLSLAVLQLSDIFLPLLQQGRNLFMSSNSFQSADAFQRKGTVTAPLIRFLRYHYYPDILDHGELQNMLEAKQPENYGDGEFNEPGGLTLFWTYVETMVLRGCMKQAWDVLKLHSVFQAALSNLDDEQVMSGESQSIVESFLALKRLMLCAPLPGGRDDAFDDKIFLPDNKGESMEEDEDDLDARFDFGQGLNGLLVEPDDYLLWEPDSESGGGRKHDGPILLLDRLASADMKHKEWKRFIRESFVNQINFGHRVPELNNILRILMGETISVATQQSWMGRLCARLLYQTPFLAPRNMQSLASREMDQGESEDGMFDILVSIMGGHASQTIEALYKLGGGSGAALPTTLLAVMFTLYLDANILPGDSIYRQTEFLCHAATSIAGSFAEDDSQVDHSTSLALQLLLPYCEENEDIRNCFVHVLDHYYPKSDTGTKVACSHVSRMLISEGGIKDIGRFLPLLEACESVLLCRYKHYMRQGKPSLAVSWLQEGIELRLHLTDFVSSGPCYRTLCLLCNSSALNLLQIMGGGLKDKDENSRIFNEAKGIVLALESQTNPSPDSQSYDLTSISEVQLLVRIQMLVDFYLVKNDPSETAKRIVECLLESRGLSGRFSTEAPLSLFWPLLVIAKDILLQEEENEGVQHSDVPSSAFSIEGVRCMLQALLQVKNHAIKRWNGTQPHGSLSLAAEPLEAAKVDHLQELLARSLARACIVENSQKKSCVITANESSDKPITQEALLRNMLDF